jgi:hypothetical protein
MGKQALKYSVGMISLFLLVKNASGTGTLFDSGARGISTVTKTFQGR